MSMCPITARLALSRAVGRQPYIRRSPRMMGFGHVPTGSIRFHGRTGSLVGHGNTRARAGPWPRSRCGLGSLEAADSPSRSP